MRTSLSLSLPVVFSALFLCAFHCAYSDQGTPLASNNAHSGSAALLMQKTPPQASDYDPLDTLTFPNLLEPESRTEFYPEVIARITAIPFKMGDRFNEGDLLVGMQNKVYEAQRFKAEKLLAKAERDLEVKQELYRKKLISLLDVKEAEANLASAEAERQTAEQNLSATQVRAPYAGRVATVHARVFEIPPKDKPLLAIINDNCLLAKFIVPAELLPRLKIGRIAYIYVEDLHWVFEARVQRIGAEVNPVSNTINVEAVLDNRHHTLISGMASFAAFAKTAFERSKPESVDEIINELHREADIR